MTKAGQEQRRSLTEWRKILGFSQEEFAQRARCSTTKLSRLETGGDTFDTMAGKRVLQTLEELGVDPLLVDKKAGLRYRQEKAEERGLWTEDGYRPTAPKRYLKDWRLARGLSQRDLGLIAKVHPGTISALENGAKPSPAPLTRQALARALRVRQNRVLYSEDEAPTVTEVRIEDRLRQDLRRVQYRLHQAYDFMREDANIAFKAQDTRDALLPEIQRELRGL